MAFLLQLTGGGALQGALALRAQVDLSRAVTESALCQARMKLKASAFACLTRCWVTHWHEALAFDRWCGLRVVAADGTCVRLARWGENIDAYGVGPLKDGSVVMARCVALFSSACRQVLEVTGGPLR